jgi:CheY-like chemotaxis protein
MKILVIEDNLAIGQIIKEILSDANYDVQIKDNSEAAAKMALDPRYDFIIIDADFEGNNGLKVIDSMCDIQTEKKARVIILRSAGEKVPSDNNYVKAIVTKPFLSSDILDAIEDINNIEEDKVENVKPDKKESRRLKRKAEPELGKSLEEMGLEFGKSYVLFQDNTREVYRVTASFGVDDCNLLMITTAKEKAMQERFRGCKIETIGLVISSFDEFSDVYHLGTMLNQINDFISKSKKPVVVFDNLNTLIYKNGTNSTFMLIHEVTSARYGKPFSLVVSVNAREFTDNDKYILKSHLEYYTPKEIKPTEVKK